MSNFKFGKSYYHVEDKLKVSNSFLNFKFIKYQFKTVWVIVLVFLIVFTILLAIANVFPLLGRKQELDKGYSFYVEGAASELLNQTIFGFGSFVIFLVFGIAMSMILINKDINRGYIVSWLATSVSRKSVFNSKLFVIISSTLIINFWIIVIEMGSFSVRMEDFKSAIGHLLLGNLGLLCFSLMIVSGIWIIFSIFRKVSTALGILLGLAGWFAICFIMIRISAIEDLAKLNYFKYFTVQSLFNSPLKFGEFNLSPNEIIVEYAKILPIKSKDYVWQIPLMFITSVTFFTSGPFLLKKKDFSF